MCFVFLISSFQAGVCFGWLVLFCFQNVDSCVAFPEILLLKVCVCVVGVGGDWVGVRLVVGVGGSCNLHLITTPCVVPVSSEIEYP